MFKWSRRLERRRAIPGAPYLRLSKRRFGQVSQADEPEAYIPDSARRHFLHSLGLDHGNDCPFYRSFSHCQFGHCRFSLCHRFQQSRSQSPPFHHQRRHPHISFFVGEQLYIPRKQDSSWSRAGWFCTSSHAPSQQMGCPICLCGDCFMLWCVGISWTGNNVVASIRMARESRHYGGPHSMVHNLSDQFTHLRE